MTKYHDQKQVIKESLFWLKIPEGGSIMMVGAFSTLNMQQGDKNGSAMNSQRLISQMYLL